MSEPVQITVRGEHRIDAAPERAVVHLAVTAESPDRGRAVADAAASVDPLRAELAAHHEAGRVTEWTSAQVSVWTDRPCGPDGQRLDPVHHATADLSATVTDIAFLDEWIAELAERPAVQLGGVTWELTPETRARLEQDAATQAVATARMRAQAYASAAGCSQVVLVELAGLGLLGAAPQAPMFARAEMAADGIAGFRPQPITVTGAVEARFRAR